MGDGWLWGPEIKYVAYYSIGEISSTNTWRQIALITVKP